MGRTLRAVIRNFLRGDFSLPLFDLNITLGDDLIGLFNVHGLTNPIALPFCLVPFKYSEAAFNFLAIFRVYLAGLSFIYLCGYFGKKNICALIGSVVYAFSGYGMLCSMRHPFFVDGMYLLPVLVVGADRIIRRDSPYTLIFAVFYSLLCGYYEFYMMTVMLLAFAAVRFFDIYKENRLKEFVHAVCRGAAAYTAGVCMAAVVFFPSAAVYLNSFRSGFRNFHPYDYSLLFILARLSSLFVPSPSMGWAWPTMAAVCAFAVVTLFFSKKQRTLKILTSAALAVFCWDVGNLAMNGFQYSSERWSFGLTLVIAYATVEMLPRLINAGRKERLACALFTAAALCCILFTKYGRTAKYAAVGLCSLLLSLQIPLAETPLFRKSGTAQRNAFTKKKRKSAVCLLIVIVNVGANGIYWAAKDAGGYSAQFADSGYEMRRLETAPERELEPYLRNNPAGRGDGTKFIRNTAAVWGIPAMLLYSPLMNKNVVGYYYATESIAPGGNMASIHNSDQRRMLLALSSAKYFVAPEADKAYVPYGYEAVKTTKAGNIIFKNKYALPWGYTYDSAVTYDTLEKQNGLQMEETMMQAVALEKIPAGYESGRIEFDSAPVPYAAAYKNCRLKGGVLTVNKAGATVSLDFNLPAGTEGYLRFKGLDVNAIDKRDVKIRVSDGKIDKIVTALSKIGPFYAGKENYIVNLGYSDKARKSLKIIFTVKGTYKVKDVELFALPVKNYPKRVNALRGEPLKNIKWGVNSLSGTADLSGDKILCVSVPYSKGWRAYVDGAETEILRANIMFMAIPLKAGHHDVRFAYRSPGLLPGAAVSLLACVCVMCFRARGRISHSGMQKREI